MQYVNTDMGICQNKCFIICGEGVFMVCSFIFESVNLLFQHSSAPVWRWSDMTLSRTEYLDDLTY